MPEPATDDYQEAPGATVDSVRSELFLGLTADQYLLPAVGPRPYADYAPEGFYPLDYQEAPGAAQYEPITPPETVDSEEARRFASRGILPESFLVPATGTSLRFSGFVRLGSTFDFDPIGTPDQFVTNTIPVPQESGQNVNFSARPSRLSFDTWTPTSLNDWNVHTLVQLDFFSGAAPGVGSSSNPRLRFAYVDYGYFRVGQDTTVFMDPQSFPFTADFAGPRGLVNVRQGLARVTLPMADQWFWAAAVEQPFSDITTYGLGENVQDVPDMTTHIRYQGDFGHAQISTIGRAIGYEPNDGDTTRRAGWGMNLTTNFHPWAILLDENPVRDPDPSGLARSRFRLQYAFGWGISRYIQDTSGLGLDGEVDPITGSFDLLYAVGWTVSYEHWFNAKWLTNITYSDASTAHNANQPGSTYAGANYLAASLWWIPVTDMSIGVEYLYGERENLDNERGVAHRVQSVFQYNF
ncbi:MAG: DcaP family trimeric outer membrane transporter [Planctomycetota bacterium]